MLIFMDGFDKYGPTGMETSASGFSATSPSLLTLLQAGEWTVANNDSSFGVYDKISVVAPLSGTGQALSFTSAAGGGNLHIDKTLTANYTRLIGGFRFQYNLGDVNPYFKFRDTTTAQCSVVFLSSGHIALYTGDGSGGTLIATSSVLIGVLATHYIEFDITFGSSTNYQVWLDGSSILSGSTGNTITSANSYANAISFVQPGAHGTTFTFDDFYLFDTTGSTNNAALLTSPRIETHFPTGDSQTQFTNSGSIIGNAYGFLIAAGSPTFSISANNLFLMPVTPAVNMTLDSVSCMGASSNGAANFKAVIYHDSGGSPNGQAVIATGTQTTGITSGSVLTSSFGSPPSLTAGTPYWIGFINDTTYSIARTDLTSSGVEVSNTYGSGAPGTCPTVTTGQGNLWLWGNCTGSSVNWVSENENPQSGDGSSITSSTVGNEDLYTFPALMSVPTAIYAASVKGYVRKTDFGSRTVDLRMKSGGADSAGSNAAQPPATTYQWMSSYFETDPNTSTAWTYTTINAAVSGIKVAS